MSLVRVARIADFAEAEIIASALQAAEIPAFVQNEAMGRNYVWQQAIGAFGIMVAEDQAREAAAFIREHRAANPELTALNDAEAAEVDEDGETWAEGRTRRRNMGARWLIVILFVGPGIVTLIILAVQLLINMLAAVLGG